MNNIKQAIIKNQIMKLVGKENEFILEVMEEAEKTTKLHPPFHSFHEGVAVIHEEFDELWDNVKLNPKKAGLTEQQYKLMMKEECVQIAAMCMRFVNELCKEKENENE